MPLKEDPTGVLVLFVRLPIILPSLLALRRTIHDPAGGFEASEARRPIDSRLGLTVGIDTIAVKLSVWNPQFVLLFSLSAEDSN